MKRPIRKKSASVRAKAAKATVKRSARATAKTTAAARSRPARKTAAKAPRARAKPAAPRRIAIQSGKRRGQTAASKPQAKIPAANANLHWTEVLRDGTHVIVRPIGKQDAVRERSFIERLSPESRRLRFLGQMNVPSEALVRQFTDIDYEHDMAFVALVHRDNETLEIGVSRYSTSADGKSCECAVTVSDEWRNKGLASILMRHLIEVARARGIRTMVSYDAVENTDMRQLADYLGFRRTTDPDDPHMVIHRLAL